ncbi:MAG TPA: PAS domain-containing protein [Bacteroidetes bacterium]|nr:PAS domain-containing protein [Bacteroidota bacterium]
MGERFHDLVHPEDRPGIRDRFNVLGSGSWDVRVLQRGGAPVWSNVSMLAPNVDGGDPLAVGDVFLFVRPIVEPDPAPRDRAALYRRALDATNNLVVITDPKLPDNPLVFVNSHFLNATGYERHEILGQNCRFLQTRPDGTRDTDQPGFDGRPGIDELRRAIAAGESTTVVLRNYRKSGEVFFNELFLTPVLDQEGEVAAYIGVQNDVTERVLAKSTLANQEQLLRAFYDASPLMMGMADAADGAIAHVSINAAARAFFGIGETRPAEPDALGFTEEETARWLEHFEACRREGRPVSFETTYPWGSPIGAPGGRYLHIVASPVGEGTLCSYVVEDRTAEASVERDRQRLQAAVESLRDPVIITDAHLDAPGPRILYVNPAYTRVFGYEPDEVIGKTPRMTQGPATDRAVLTRLRHRLEAGEPFVGEAVNYRKDGTPFLLEWEIVAIPGADGTPQAYVWTMRDVTDRRRLERAVSEATVREQERMARDLHDGLGQVLASTRFALSGVASTLTRDEHPEAPSVTAASDRIGEALELAHTIARGLLPTHLEGEGLPSALARLADDLSRSYAVACSFTGGLQVRPESRAEHLYRIAQEAATNAIRHGGAGRVCLSLQSHADDPDGYGASLTIRDDGCGISPDRVNGTRDGLGLRSMRFRAHAIGGCLAISRAPEGGTVVVCRFDPEGPSSGDGSSDPVALGR